MFIFAAIFGIVSIALLSFYISSDTIGTMICLVHVPMYLLMGVVGTVIETFFTGDYTATFNVLFCVMTGLNPLIIALLIRAGIAWQRKSINN